MFPNVFLIIGALLSVAAALLHIAIIWGGEKGYHYFGVGNHIADAARDGRWYPAIMMSCVTVALFFASAYALAGAHLLPPLPCLTPVLILVTSLYLLRGLLLVPMLMMKKQDVFMLISSLVCLGYGLIHLLGLWQFLVQQH